MTTYTEEEFNRVMLKENKYTKLIPSYIRDYPKFITLMKLFSNYIQSSCDVIETMLSKLNIRTAKGDLLEKIAQRLDIFIEKPLKPDGTVDQDQYDQELRIAILGNGLKRNNTATRASLMKITEVFQSITGCEIADFSNFETSNPMNVRVNVYGNTYLWTAEMFEKYVLPNITGIGIEVVYVINNDMYFGYDIETNIHIIGSILQTTENVTQQVLNDKATELGVDPVFGDTIVDADNNGWVFMNVITGWINKGTVLDGAPVTNEKGYGIQGWDKGKWANMSVTE